MRRFLRLLVWSGAAVVVIIIIAVAASSHSGTNASGVGATAGAPRTAATGGSGSSQTTAGLTLVSGSLALTAPDAGGVRYVTGSIKNNANHMYNYVEVDINEYDKSGAQVGSTLTNVNNLAAGGTWKFKAVVIQQSTATVKVTAIKGV